MVNGKRDVTYVIKAIVMGKLSRIISADPMESQGPHKDARWSKRERGDVRMKTGWSDEL